MKTIRKEAIPLCQDCRHLEGRRGEGAGHWCAAKRRRVMDRRLTRRACRDFAPWLLDEAPCP
jgi:hypothetical protein